MKLSDVYALEKVRNMLASGEVKEHVHPDGRTRMWSLQWEIPSCVTSAMAGGVIFRDGELLARPIRKFWAAETEGFPETKMKNLSLLGFKKAVCTEWIDGHAGLLYHNQHGVKMLAGADGSFRGQPWIWASGYVRESHRKDEWPFSYTPNFCVVHPEHVKTIKYEEPRIYLIGMINMETGEELPWQDVKDWANYNGFAVPRIVEASPWDFPQMKLEHRGVVMRWDFRGGQTLRVGWKTEEYEQQSVLTGLTPKDIADLIEEDVDLEPLKQHGSDRFKRWLENWRGRLNQEYYAKESRLVELTALVENVTPPVAVSELEALMDFFGKCVEGDTWALPALEAWLRDEQYYPVLWAEVKKITRNFGRFEE